MRFLGILLLFLVFAGVPAHAAPPTADQQREFRNIIRGADAVMLLESTAAEARKRCEAARSYAARFDAGDFWPGVVEYCLGQVALYEKKKPLACTHFARALALLVKAPRGALDANAMGARTSEEYQKLSRDARRKLGC